MGLQEPSCRFLDAWLHPSYPTQISASGAPTRPQHAPNPWTQPVYGTKIQLTTPADTTNPLSPTEIQRIQQVVGTLLYYARAVDGTMLVALGTIAAAQAKGTQHTNKIVNHLLDYCHAHPDATLRYRASDMILKSHSDASYLSEANARSQAGGHFYLGDKQANQPERGNGALLNKTKIMQNVMSSAAEAKCGAVFENTTDAVPLRTT